MILRLLTSLYICIYHSVLNSIFFKFFFKKQLTWLSRRIPIYYIIIIIQFLIMISAHIISIIFLHFKLTNNVENPMPLVIFIPITFAMMIWISILFVDFNVPKTTNCIKIPFSLVTILLILFMWYSVDIMLYLDSYKIGITNISPSR